MQQDIRKGTTVYTTDGQVLGTVERVEGKGFYVNGRSIPHTAVGRTAKDGLYLNNTFDYNAFGTAGTSTGRTEIPGIEAPGPLDRALDRDRNDRADILEGTARGVAASGRTIDTEGEVRVPVVEEQLQVGKREAELGEVQVRKTVTAEEQSVPVTLRREEVHVEEIDVAERPLRADETAFQEETIRVPVRGEEAIVQKEAVVTGEVVVNREATTDTRQVSDTVRREHVEVDENYRQARTGFEQHFAQGSARTGRTFAQAEPNYRAGYEAARDARYQGRSFDEIEPDMRREWETSSAGRSGDGWERLREEIRHGYDTRRNYTATDYSTGDAATGRVS